MPSLLLLSNRPWNRNFLDNLSTRLNYSVFHLTKSSDLTPDFVSSINPDWIFAPHWSYLIPESIWGSWPTVIFHMTDLPFGRGGSPLQNLIARGHTSTMLSALKCSGGFDSGDIFLKVPLSLYGSAEEIFLRAAELIQDMIVRIVNEDIVPHPQEGEPVLFTRRTPSQSDLGLCPVGDLAAWYDAIRMLDATDYPHAYIEFNGMKLEFRRVSQRSDGLYADVKISSSTDC